MNTPPRDGATALRLPTTAESALPVAGTAFVLSYIEQRLPMSEAEAELMRRLSASEQRVQTLFLAVVSAFCFGSVGAVYALNGTISKIYLADAVVEAALIAALLRG